MRRKRTTKARRNSAPKRTIARRNPVRRRRRAPSRRPRAVRRRTRRNPATRAVARRITHRNPRRRRSVRSYARRGGRALKSYLSKDTGIVAASVVGGFTLTQYIFAKFGHQLPGYVGADGNINRWVAAAYGVGMPVAAGALTLRMFKQPRVAEGLIIAGFVNGISVIVDYFQESMAPAPAPAATEGASAYLTPTAGMPTPGYSGSNAFGAYPMGQSIYDSQSAFEPSAW